MSQDNIDIQAKNNEKIVAQNESDFIKQLEKQFNPHYNLFNKNILKQKIGCFNQFKLDGQKYHECFRNIQTQQRLNLNTLNSKTGYIEDNYIKCKDTCNISFQKSDNNFIVCNQKCFKPFQEEVLKAYNAHFKQILSGVQESNKLRYN